MLKRFNAFVYGETKKIETPINESVETQTDETVETPTDETVETPNILLVKEELCDKYLYTDDNNGVIGITVESDDTGQFIQFNIECETELTSINEYKGCRLHFNRLCEVPIQNEKIVEEKSEEEIIEEYKLLNENFINQYLK